MPTQESFASDMLREVTKKCHGKRCDCGGEFKCEGLTPEIIAGEKRCRILVPCGKCGVRLLYEAVMVT